MLKKIPDVMHSYVCCIIHAIHDCDLTIHSKTIIHKGAHALV